MMSITANNWIYEESLSAKAKNVYLNLVHRSNKENTCFPGLKRIARECSISLSSVQRALRELVEEGFIKKEARYRENRSQTSNLYILVEDAVERAARRKPEVEKKMNIEMDMGGVLEQNLQLSQIGKEPENLKMTESEEQIIFEYQVQPHNIGPMNEPVENEMETVMLSEDIKDIPLTQQEPFSIKCNHVNKTILQIKHFFFSASLNTLNTLKNSIFDQGGWSNRNPYELRNMNSLLSEKEKITLHGKRRNRS